MDPAVLRFGILQLVEQHEAVASGAYLADAIMALQLGVPLTDVQRQLLILENREMVELTKVFGPSYGALLTPRGMEALEGANSQQPLKGATRRIGF